MDHINEWLKQNAHNYALIAFAAILFFLIKAIIGFFTYKHYDKQLKALIHKVDSLLEDQTKTN